MKKELITALATVLTSTMVRLYRQLNKQKEFTGALSAYDENTVTLTMEDGSQMVFEKADIALIRLALDF